MPFSAALSSAQLELIPLSTLRPKPITFILASFVAYKRPSSNCFPYGRTIISIMSNNGTVNLGQACFKTADPPLQLQLTATGHFKSPIDCPVRNLEIEHTQLSHILTAWVTEAPQLEIRLHIDINPRLEWTLSRLVSSLGERMFSSKVCIYDRLCFGYYLTIGFDLDLVRSWFYYCLQEL